MRVFGIDPGIERLGYAIVDFEGSSMKPVSYGLISTSSETAKPERLYQIYRDLHELSTKYRPDYASIETLIFAKNVKTALTVSEVRGVILLLCAQEKIPVYEFTPLQVKIAVTSYGRSSKSQMEQAIKILLKLTSIPKPDDVTDALAIAVCGGNHISFDRKINGNASGRP